MLSFSLFILRFLGPLLLLNSLIFSVHRFSSLFTISILIMPFLIAFSNLCIILNFTKSYVVLYPLQSSFLLSFFCSCSLFSFLEVKFFIDDDSWSDDSKNFKASTYISTYFSIIFVCISYAFPSGK